MLDREHANSEDIVELLAELNQLGVRLTVQQDQLIIDAPQGCLNSRWQQLFKQHKVVIIDYLVNHGIGQAELRACQKISVTIYL